MGLCLWQLFVVSMVSGNAIFEVEHKFKGGKRTLKELRDHDLRRHGRLLASIELPLGGDSSPTGTGFVSLFSFYESHPIDRCLGFLHFQFPTC